MSEEIIDDPWWVPGEDKASTEDHCAHEHLVLTKTFGPTGGWTHFYYRCVACQMEFSP